MSGAPVNARRSRWTSPGFLLAVAILSVSAAGLNAAISALQLHFKKQPVPLAAELSTIPARLGPWQQVTIDEPVDHAVQEELGTTLYVFRTYVDTRRVPAVELARFDGQDSRGRARLAEQLQLSRPDAVVNMAVTYYTGMVDTVAHIPERCYVASGFVPRGHDVLSWPMGPDFAGNDGRHELDVEAIAFDDSVAGAGMTRVAYCFCADGHWECDSLRVRQRLQDLRAVHAFYAKVELRTVIADAAQSNAVMADYLRSALPAVQKCLPDWDAVERKSPPPAAAAAPTTGPAKQPA